MGVVVDMILTVAAVARAFGAIAEFKAGIGDLGPPADRAAEAGAVAGAGRVIDRALFDRALPAFLRRMPADEVGQEVTRNSPRICLGCPFQRLRILRGTNRHLRPR